MQQGNVTRDDHHGITRAAQFEHAGEHPDQGATIGKRVVGFNEPGLRPRQFAHHCHWAAAESALKQPCYPLPQRRSVPVQQGLVLPEA